MKNSQTWHEDEIVRMIKDQVEESLILDYKGARAFHKEDNKKKESIAINVSAFANSAGGTILYGVAEDEHNHLPEKIEGIDPIEFKKEWLEEIINSRVHKRIEGIEITPIKLSGINVGKVIYAIDIPQSLDAPHQASDHRYYKRYNFQSISMEDYEIRDVSNRRRNPVVIPRITAGLSNQFGEGHFEGFISLILVNEGQSLANKIYIELALPEVATGQMKRFPGNDTERKNINEISYFVYKYIHRDASGLLPLFPGAKIEIFDGNSLFLNLALDRKWTANQFKIPVICTVFADNAQPQSISVPLKDFASSDLKTQLNL